MAEIKKMVEQCLEFQSAPLTDVRGDGDGITYVVRDEGFQSAPLTDVRGDAWIGWCCPSAQRFQSAPLTDVRGDSGCQ